MSGEYKFYVRNSDNTGWVNILKDSQIEIDSDGVAGGQFAGDYLDEVLVELKALAGGGAPGYAGTPIHIINTDDVTDSGDETGSFSTAGGMSVAQSLFVGGNLTVETTADFDGIATFNSSINIATDITSVKNVTGDGTGDLSGFVNLTATGDVDAANATLSGLTTTDTLLISSTVDGNIVPTTNGTQFLGSPIKKWNTVYVGTISADTVNSTAFTGIFTGTLNGGVVGNVSGNVTGNLDGDLIGSPTVTVTSNENSISTTTGAFVVEGGLGVAMDTFIGGDLTVTGTLSAAGLDVGFDAIGESIIPDTNNAYNLGASTTGLWANVYATTFNGDLVGDVTGDLDGDLVKTTTVNVTNTTGATSSTTGALVVSGGVGIDENLFVGQSVTIAGSLNVAGAYTPSSVSTAQMFVTGIIASTNKDTGALIIANGGLGVEGNVNAGGNLGVLGSGAFGTTLGVSGATVLSSTLQVVGAVDINSSVDVDIIGGDFDVLTDGIVKLEGSSIDIDATTTLDILADTIDITGTTSVDINTSGTIDILSTDPINITSSTSGVFVSASTLFQVTGSAQFNDNLTIGVDNSDTVIFNSKITGPIVPFDGAQNLGLTAEPWNVAYINKIETRGNVSTTNNSTGDIVSLGGVAIQDNLWVDGTATIGGITTIGGIATITDTTQATTKDTGALIVEGGVGIEKDLFVGGNVYSNTLTATTFIGNLNGNVTGNVIGDIIGDLNGDLISSSPILVNGNGTPTITIGTGSMVIQGGTGGPTAPATGAGLSVEGTTWIGGDLHVDFDATISGDLIVTTDVTINGNLTVNGTTTTVNSTTVTTADNLIVINDGEVGAGVTLGFGGIEVDRGSETNYQFLFNESDDTFRIGEAGSLQAVATREDTPLGGGIPTWNATALRFDTAWAQATDTQTLSGGKYLCGSTVTTGLTLPATPFEGQMVWLKDQSGTWGATPITINSNGSEIEGIIQNLILNVPSATLEMVFTTSDGWKII